MHISMELGPSTRDYADEARGLLIWEIYDDMAKFQEGYQHHSKTYESSADNTRISQQDFELAAWQMTYLCIAPRRV